LYCPAPAATNILILCCPAADTAVDRAEHAASKHLKETYKLPKAREETLKEALKRITHI
jgi:hypothetical protein